jgi:hypothetical protein
MTFSTVDENPRSIRQRWLIGLAVLLIAIVFILGLFYLINVFSPPTGSHLVTYIVHATSGGAMVTYTMANGQISENQDVHTPWQFSVELPSKTEVYLTVAAQNDSATLDCVLLLDGQDWKKSSVVAPGMATACAGIVP